MARGRKTRAVATLEPKWPQMYISIYARTFGVRINQGKARIETNIVRAGLLPARCKSTGFLTLLYPSREGVMCSTPRLCIFCCFYFSQCG